MCVCVVCFKNKKSEEGSVKSKRNEERKNKGDW